MSLRRLAILAATLLVGAASQSAAVEPWRDWSETSATAKFYNVQAQLPWQNPSGDWRDADGVPQGPKPFAEIKVTDTDSERWESWNVTAMVRAWLSGSLPNRGVMLKSQRGEAHFASLQSPDPNYHPHLLVRTADGKEHRLAATDDTYLHGSTTKLLGLEGNLKIGWGMVKFDLSKLAKGVQVTEASMRLYTFAQYGGAIIGVYQPDMGRQGPPIQQEPLAGLAEKYPGDRGIGDDSAVVLFADFEKFDWTSRWVIDQDPKTITPVKAAADLKFEPLSGMALQAVIPRGGNTALNLLYKFADDLGYEPEEIYFRYYLRLAETWNPTVQGGKMPGIAGTYGRAGWGGRRSDGQNGWSMRGSFGLAVDERNPMRGLTPMGTYAYFADMPGQYGSIWGWTQDGLGALKRNRWYSIEQHVKLNTPGQHDGIMRAWVDGKPAYVNDKVMFRTTDALKIDRIWMNVFHGGTAMAPTDYHLFIDNVVVAKQYIGPIAGRVASE